MGKNRAGKKRLSFSRRTQRILTVLTGTVLTIGCCLLAEQYTGGESAAVRTSALPEAAASDGESRLLILSYHQVLPTAEDCRAAQESGEEHTLLLSDFKEDLSWLSEEGYTFLLPSDLKQAVQGIGALPEKGVLLTFEDGYESFYTVVWPQLRESGGKGAVGVIGSEADLCSGSIDASLTDSFLSWEQLRQIDRSDCTEIASMGYDLCLDAEDWWAAASGSTGRLSSLLRLLGRSGSETPAIPEENLLLYRASIRKDALTMGEKLRAQLYHDADAFFLPSGCHDAEVDEALADAGLLMTFAAGVSAEQADSVWNTVSDHDSLFGLVRISRPNDGSLQEYLSEYTS